MRFIKMLSMTAIAAMAAMAFLGASSASADSEHIVLCKVAELECAKANWLPNPTKIVGHAEKPKLLSSIGTIECDKSLAELEVLNTLSTLIKGHLKSLTFEGNCHLNSTSCTVTTGPLGSLSFTKIGPLSASVLSIEEGTEANVKCGFLINCTYGGSPLLEAHSLKDGMTHLLANKTVLTKSKGICPEVSEWDANYLALETFWIES